MRRRAKVAEAVVQTLIDHIHENGGEITVQREEMDPLLVEALLLLHERAVVRVSQTDRGKTTYRLNEASRHGPRGARR